MTFGSRFSAYELEYVKNLLLDVYIPEIAAGHTVRIGANNKGYTSISFDVYIDSVEGNRVTKIEGIGATSAPVNNCLLYTSRCV